VDPKSVTVEGVGGQVYSGMPVIDKVKSGGVTFTVLQAPGKCKHGFIGMNQKAASTIKVKTNQPYDVIVHCQGTDTIQHEIMEQYIMRYGRMHHSTKKSRKNAGCSKQGIPYEIAHKIALRFEGTKVTPKEALQWYYKQCDKYGRQVFDWGEKF